MNSKRIECRGELVTRVFSLLTGAFLAALLTGCETLPQTRLPDGTVLNRIPGVESIAIPSGVSDKTALDAVEQTIDLAHDGKLPNYRKGQWCVEDRDASNKWIKAGFTVRKHYLCVCWRIEGGRIVPDVPNSRNLDQDGCSIHRKVPAWINTLRPVIAERLYKATKVDK